MKRFSNSWTASSKRTPLSTISSTSFSSLSLIMRLPHVGSRSLQLLPCEPLEGIDVLGAGLEDDVIGKARHRRLLVPADGFEIVADELLVEARLRTAGGVAVARPEA